MRQAIAYIRVSTDDQRLGPDAQRAAIEAWALRELTFVIAWHVDQGVSGAAPIEERPGLSAALAALERTAATVLVVAKRDRLARDVVVAALVERAAAKAGATVVSAAGEGNGETPADCFMKTVIDGASAYERGLIRARTKAALAAKKAKGECVGRIPFGSRLGADGKRLERCPVEGAIVDTVVALRATGATQAAIASELARRGMFSRRGTPLSQTQVCRILARAG